MNFSQLLGTSAFPAVWSQLITMPEINNCFSSLDACRNAYAQNYQKLSSISPMVTDHSYVLHFAQEDRRLCVHALDLVSEYCLDFFDWAEILNFQVAEAELLQYGAAAVIAAVLYEITG